MRMELKLFAVAIVVFAELALCHKVRASIEIQRALAPRNVAVVLRGEAYRTNDRTQQWQAWQSILDFLVKPLEAANFHVDIISATYSTRLPTRNNLDFAPSWLDKMTEIFGSRLTQDLRIDPGQNSGEVGFKCRLCQTMTPTAALKAVGDGNRFRWIALLRHDLELKVNLADAIINARPEGRFLFPFRMARSVHAMVQFFWLPDTFQVFDGKYLDSFLRAIQQGWPIEKDIFNALRIGGGC
eukprot:TRINITY_DN9891_c0_g1_i1.p1 TRINITY_DN9891_c0_g1~~TRINITY_DN9891_c0_g1_i1.p1  ORF type:complete len:241 (-),score=35.95 TRINITY_DN9891_c0_g1_i1:487-1209(-)